MAYSRMKEYAKSMPSEFPGRIMGKFSIDLQDETISKMPAPDHLKKTLYNKKRAKLPPLPANLDFVTFCHNKRLNNLCERPIPEADEEKVELLNSFALLF